MSTCQLPTLIVVASADDDQRSVSSRVSAGTDESLIDERSTVRNVHETVSDLLPMCNCNSMRPKDGIVYTEAFRRVNINFDYAKKHLQKAFMEAALLSVGARSATVACAHDGTFGHVIFAKGVDSE